MSVNSNSSLENDTSFSPKRIRSKHRYRILLELSIGDLTVSELAIKTGLRIPHASAEIRRMRSEQIISSDLPAGSRGAQIRLTEKGWSILISDELSKAQSVNEFPDNNEKYCILSRDESYILIGLLAKPKEQMIPIPNRILDMKTETRSSIRNQGVDWNWAVFLEKYPRWFDLDKLEIISESPKQINPEKIENYMRKKSIIGVIRAKLLDPDFQINLSPGTWFALPEYRPNPPLTESTYYRGNWTLGFCHSLAPDIRPNQPILVNIKQKLPKSVLLRSASNESLLIADLSGIDIENRFYPISSLDFWIDRAHPRLSDSEKRKRLHRLKERLLSSRKIRAKDATWRRFRKDWSGCEFIENESQISMIDLRGIGNYAIESLIRWALEDNIKDELVLEISSEIPLALLSKISSHPRLRMVLIEKESKFFANFDKLSLDNLRTLPWLQFSTIEGKIIPIRLPAESQTLPKSKDSKKLFISPWKLLGLEPEVDSKDTLVEGDEASIITSAISQFPEGNEKWANQIEANYPLAAWIASPPKDRWPRWQRIDSRLNPEWLALLDIDYLPMDKLSLLANQTSESVLKIYSKKISSKLRNNPDYLLKSWPAIDSSKANRGASWLASEFITNSPWLPSESHLDLLDWAIEAWLSNPPKDSLPALRGIQWLYKNNSHSNISTDTNFNHIIRRGLDLSADYNLFPWAVLLEHTLGNRKASNDELILITKALPTDWWSHISEEILITILDNNGLQELENSYCSWASSILRRKGEICSTPGLSDTIHPGVSNNLLTILDKSLKGINPLNNGNNGINSLLDLKDSLSSVKQGKAPSSGLTHRLIGWLAQPVDSWPEFTISEMLDGDNYVAKRLILRESGYNESLT